MKPKTYEAKLSKAVDGDTFDALIDLGWNVFIQYRIRVNAINCAEMHGAQAEMGHKAQTEARTWLMKPVTLVAYDHDKYGRRICDIICEGVDYGKYMIEKGLANAAKYSLTGGDFVSIVPKPD